MRETSLLFAAGVFLLLNGELSHTVRHRQQRCSDGQLSDLNNDFENSDGSPCPWIEESQGGARWDIENYYSPWEPDCPAPQPSNGSSYLRVNRGTTLSFGVAVLRSPTFTLVPGVNSTISFTFSFWIQSKWPQFTNLELYLAKDGNERLLKSLSNYIDNDRKWQSKTINFVNEDFSSNVFSLVFYAYCGTDIEDAVAIDDIHFNATLTQATTTTDGGPNSSTTTSTTKTSTTTASTTTASTTTASTTTTPISSSPITSSSSVSTSSPSSLCNEEKSIRHQPWMRDGSSPFICPNNTEMSYADPEDPCSGSYYKCENCEATRQKCAGNQAFKEEAQKCCPCSKIPDCKNSKDCNNFLLDERIAGEC